MPTHYRFHCCECGHTELRYRNAQACCKCGSHKIMRLGTRKTKAEVGQIIYDLLFNHMPETPEEIDAFLCAKDIDPEGVAKKGREFVEGVLRECRS